MKPLNTIIVASICAFAALCFVGAGITIEGQIMIKNGILVVPKENNAGLFFPLLIELIFGISFTGIAISAAIEYSAREHKFDNFPEHFE